MHFCCNRGPIVFPHVHRGPSSKIANIFASIRARLALHCTIAPSLIPIKKENYYRRRRTCSARGTLGPPFVRSFGTIAFADGLVLVKCTCASHIIYRHLHATECVCISPQQFDEQNGTERVEVPPNRHLCVDCRTVDMSWLHQTPPLSSSYARAHDLISRRTLAQTPKAHLKKSARNCRIRTHTYEHTYAHVRACVCFFLLLFYLHNSVLHSNSFTCPANMGQSTAAALETQSHTHTQTRIL